MNLGGTHDIARSVVLGLDDLAELKPLCYDQNLIHYEAKMQFPKFE